MRANITGMCRLWALVMLFFIAACSSEKPPAVSDQPPAPTEGTQYTLEIRPANATRNATIYAIPSGFALTDATIEWLVNGAPAGIPATGQFIASEINKKDTVQAKATVEGTVIFSNTIQIENAPPELSSVKLLPRAMKPGGTLGVEATASDIDGDEVTISYEWMKNGEPAGNTAYIESLLKKGDKISVTITPYDGEVYGRPIVLQRDVLNAIPVILENRKFGFDGKLYTYQVNATDSDEDTLAYSLKSGPAGMTINSSTGLIKWNVPSEFVGKTSFTVSVSDGRGGEAVQTFPFEMRLEQKR